MNALEYLRAHLKYEKHPKIKEAITQKFAQYLRRTEEIQAIFDAGGSEAKLNRDTAAGSARSNTQTSGGEEKNKEDPEHAKLKSALDSVIIKEIPNDRWSDIAGLESAKQALQEAVILPVNFPQFFTGKRQPWRAFLLYGPPGTGKSYLAKAVATEADSTFFRLRMCYLNLSGKHEMLDSSGKPLKECGFLVNLLGEELLILTWRNLMHRALLQRYFHHPSLERILIKCWLNRNQL